jgi:hypothetical protein
MAAIGLTFHACKRPVVGRDIAADRHAMPRACRPSLHNLQDGLRQGRRGRQVEPDLDAAGPS